MVPVVDVSQLPAHVAAKIRTHDSGCWIWQGARHPQGHGNAYLAGRFTSAHRLVYELLVGPLSPGLLLHHECRVKPCVNPAHLTVMTKKAHSAEHGLTGIAAVHASQTTCVNGHPFDVFGGRQRICSTCRRDRGREWARQKRKRVAA